MAKDDMQDEGDLMDNMSDRDQEQLQKDMEDADRDENMESQQGQ